MTATKSDFELALTALLRARFPYLYLPTWEEERALQTIRNIAGNAELLKTPKSFFSWTFTQGFTPSSLPVTEEKPSAIGALTAIDQYPDPGVFVLQDFHAFLSESNTDSETALLLRKLRDMIPGLKRLGKTVVFVSPSLTLPMELQKDIHILEFPMPGVPEIKALLTEMIVANRNSGRIVLDLPADDIEKLVKAALGLTLQEAENAFAYAMANDGRLDHDDIRIVMDQKQQIIKKNGTLEFVPADLDLEDVGGLENLKAWLATRNQSWLDSAQRYGLPSPKGILMTGVPGCGKSLTAKAISAAWQLPLLRLDIDKVFSPYIGSTEENMRNALKTAEAIAPCILWIDEIEKGFSGMGSDSDGGVSSRVFGTFLTWMQEKTQSVFVVATANNIKALPSEFLRKGRFDEIFFVDLPTAEERADIFKIHLTRRLTDPQARGDFALTPETFQLLAQQSEGLIGAEIEEIILSGLFQAFSEQRGLTLADLQHALQQTVPLSVTQAEQVAGMREWAKTRAVSATQHSSPKASPPQAQFAYSVPHASTLDSLPRG